MNGQYFSGSPSSLHQVVINAQLFHQHQVVINAQLFHQHQVVINGQ